MLGELWWVLPAAVFIGVGVAALCGLVVWAFGDDEPEEPEEWDKLPEHERDFLRNWAKHRK